MNKKLLPVLVISLLGAACLCKERKNTQPLVQESAVISAEITETAPVSAPLTSTGPQQPLPPQEQPLAQKAEKPVKKAAPAAVTPEKTPVVLPTENASVPQEQNSPLSQEQAPQPSPAENETDAFSPETAAPLIAADRSAQTLQTPVPDQAVFEDEPLIPLNGRRLSPLAYEPLQKDMSSAQWSGEQLKFGVYYSFIKAGTAYIKNRGLTEVNGRKAFLIQTTAFSASVIDSVFKVRDVNYSWIDAETFKSLGYTQSLREGNYQRDEWLTFDVSNHRYYGEVQKKEEPHVIVGTLEEDVLDMLSSLYYVRTQPLATGQDIVFDIVNREKQYPLVVKVLKQETIKTPAGKFKCWVVEPKFRGEGIFVAKGKSLKVWLTADEYKMPVKMQAEVFIGSVKAELLEYRRN